MKVDIRVMQAFVDIMVGIDRFSYPARQQGDKPKGEFAHISLIDEYQESIPSTEVIAKTTTTITYLTSSLAKLRFRVGIVETDGMASTKIMHGWTSELMKAEMIKSGYGFVKCNPIGLEDAKLEKEWETRQGLSVELYVVRTYEEVVSTIDSMQITGGFTTPSADTYLLDININN